MSCINCGYEKDDGPFVTPGVYQHWKGGFYRVLFVAFDSADILEYVVVYMSMTDGRVWTRPAKEFDGYVQTDPRSAPVKRFTQKSTA